MALLAKGERAGAVEHLAPVRSETPIVLPVFIVEDAQHRIEWRYASVPGIEVLSSCDAGETEDFLESYAGVVARFRTMVPESLLRRTAVPSAIVLLDTSTNEYAKEVTQQMVQMEYARLMRERTGALVNGATPELRGPEGTLLNPAARRLTTSSTRFFPNLRFADQDSSVTFVVLRPGSFDRRGLTLAIDDVQFLLDRRVPALPRWYIDGVLRLYPTADLHEEALRFAAFEWGPEDERRRLVHGLGVAEAFPPLMKLFTEPASADAIGRRHREQTLALFIRWCLQRPETSQALARFVDRCALQPPTEEMFTDCFGVESTQIDVAAYFIHQADSRRQELEPSQPWPEFRVRSRPATVPEIARIRGDFERRAANYVRQNQPELADQYAAQAEKSLARGLKQGSPDPSLLVVAALSHCDAQDDAGARPLLELAVRDDVQRPRAYFELARIRYAEMLARSTSTGHRLSAEQTEELLQLLHHAAQMPPPLLETYLLAGDVWLHSTRLPPEAEIAFLAEGMRDFPANRTLRQSVSVLSATSLAGPKP